MEPFVDGHRKELIRRATVVDPILDDIKDLLTTENYEYIRSRPTSQEKMESLFGYVSGWSDGDKDILYKSLKKHNEQIIRDLEKRKKYKKPVGRLPLCPSSPPTRSSSNVDSNVYPLPKFFEHVVPEHAKINLFPRQGDHLQCNFCGKDEDSACVASPVINGMVYRLELQSAGLFRCSKTGIKFQVTHPVTIEYELDSWNSYSFLIHNISEYEILGPLFNIKTDLEPGVVSAVYLPHCLCLKGFKGDLSCIICAHFKDDNIALEAPTRVEPYYVVLENPTFSPIGVLLYPLMWLKDGIIKLVSFHGMVLIYWRISGVTDSDHKKIRIHLYLMPCNKSFEMDINNFEKNLGYDRLCKPHQTGALYCGRTYEVKASQNARVLPKMLLFQSNYISGLYPYTEVTVDGKKTNEDIALAVEDCGSLVWIAEVDRGDINDLETKISGHPHQEGVLGRVAGLSVQESPIYRKSRKSTKTLQSPPVKEPAHVSASEEHFVDKHRPDLIRAISLVEPILEELRSMDLLTDEQYETVCRKPTSQEQMRELYRYISYWGNGDKDEVYHILRKHNRPVINRLETEGY